MRYGCPGIGMIGAGSLLRVSIVGGAPDTVFPDQQMNWLVREGLWREQREYRVTRLAATAASSRGYFVLAAPVKRISAHSVHVSL
jgi:hypothetical protein